MKINLDLKFFGIVIVAALTIVSCQRNPSPSEKRLEKMMGPVDEEFLMKYGDGDKFALQTYERALAQAHDLNKSNHNRVAGNWVVQGPGNLGGRINSIAIHPTNPNIQYLGFSKGGIYRTTDNGANWSPIFDDKMHLNIGDVAIDPTNPSIVYAGTGDPNISGYPSIGDGIYKSTNGGNTWTNIGLKETRIISKIHVSAQSPNTLYAGAMGLPFIKNSDRGLYKSTNGGTSWSKILYINDSTGITDIAVDPTNDQIVYVASWNRLRNNKKSVVSGPDANIYKSINGGGTWTKLSNGLPTGDFSRIAIDISQSNPNVLYTSYVSASSLNISHILKTSDGGQSWIELKVGSEGLDPSVTGGFGWYFGKIVINPINPNDIFVLGVDLWRSKDSGITWAIATPEWWQYAVHADKHDLVFDLNGKMHLATDGGAYSSADDGNTWIDTEDIPTNQIYRVAYNPHLPDNYYGGLQDNGTTGGNAGIIDNWNRIFGGDGFQALFDPTNPEIIYAETQNGGLVYSETGGDFFDDFTDGIIDQEPRNWDMPFVQSAFDPKLLVTGTDRIYVNKSAPLGVWEVASGMLTDSNSTYLRKNISNIALSPLDARSIMVGTSDARVWITKDLGNSFENITAGLPDRYISSVAFSPTNSNRIYVGLSGYRDNDDSPLIFRSDDFGKTWKSLGQGLPNLAINKVLVLPPVGDIAQDHVFVGTDGGVYYLNEFNNSWSRVGDNMVTIPVYDLCYNPIRNELVAGTFGRSIMSFDLGQIGYVVATNDLGAPKIDMNSTVVSNELTFRITDPNQITYKVTNVSGKLIHTGQCHEVTTVDADDWLSGVYFLSVYQKGKFITTSKFVKI